MSRAARLLSLIELLRQHRRPVSGAHLAQTLGISLRTLYRDIASLQAQGAAIDGAPGFGYVLQPGFMLPPLMFTAEEIEALVLGSRWVASHADPRLGGAARQALAKIAAVLPAEARQLLESAALLVGPPVAAAAPGEPSAGDAGLATLRLAIRAEHRLTLRYRDVKGQETERSVWPIALGFFDRTRVLVAWCELRQALRHFRTDRITALSPSQQRYPRRRQVLLREWREAEGIAEP
ncbi:helix-turn-helix transcriptional regulator [Ideonella livida]|uniref:YafY family transcriptional regulator n=1 Tax=Ideonella livida TaxID=2707176 RepID=A0A7C9TMA1_9BURK|nr:YafY family protein [Ideonella livida]NDY93798.1 YafY family transcriptional regulator [Ideonella livida]